MPRTVTAGHVEAMPVDRRARELLDAVEDQWFERKSIRVSPVALANTMVGFANAEGGTVVIGLSQGRVEGVDGYPEKVNALRRVAVELTDPPVRAPATLVACERDDGARDHLLLIEVEPGHGLHANQKDEVYLRVGDATTRLTYRQRTELAYDKGQASFETETTTGATLDDLDRRVITEYARQIGHPNPTRMLVGRGLATPEGAVTNAGVLLFAATPERWFPAAHVRVVRYAGRDRGTGSRQQVVSDVRCEGPIPKVLRRARLAVRRAVPTRKALQPDGRFGPVPRIPEEVWLEAVVNAVVHRSYSLAGDHVRVEVFDDRVEVASPGRFPGVSDTTDPLRIVRYARNPRIARACADLRFGQEFGEGIRRMFEEMRFHGLADPIYEQTSAGVRVTLLAEPVDRALDARLPRETRVILGILRDAGRLGTGELADAIGLARPATIRRLNALRDAGLVVWVGNSPKDPRAYWTLP